jgi:hypothetical protein
MNQPIQQASNQPNRRAEEVRQERRRKPGSVVAAGIKLAVDESKLDRANFEYRWAKDFGGRTSQLHAEDWDPAPEQAALNATGPGTVNSTHGGVDEHGKPYNMVLLRKRKDWYRADQREKRKPLDEMDAAIRRGTNHQSETGQDAGAFYTPGGGNKIER